MHEVLISETSRTFLTYVVYRESYEFKTDIVRSAAIQLAKRVQCTIKVPNTTEKRKQEF